MVHALLSPSSSERWNLCPPSELKNADVADTSSSCAQQGIDVVINLGFDPYEKKLMGVTAIRKMLGKKQFDKLFSSFINKPKGKPTLAPQSDKRPVWNTAQEDYKEEN